METKSPEERLKDIAQKHFKGAQQLNYEVLKRILDLSIAGFGLVAALAWNEAIKALFDAIFPRAGGLIAQFVYAAVITIVVVFVTIRLGKLANLAKDKLSDEEKEKLDKQD